MFSGHKYIFLALLVWNTFSDYAGQKEFFPSVLVRNNFVFDSAGQKYPFLTMLVRGQRGETWGNPARLSVGLSWLTTTSTQAEANHNSQTIPYMLYVLNYAIFYTKLYQQYPQYPIHGLQLIITAKPYSRSNYSKSHVWYTTTTSTQQTAKPYSIPTNLNHIR